MLKRFDNPAFMEIEEIDRVYEGMWVLVKQDNKDAHTWEGGYVVAMITDSPDSRSILRNLLENELNFQGYIHYGYIDKGESLDVVYIKIKSIGWLLGAGCIRRWRMSLIIFIWVALQSRE